MKKLPVARLVADDLPRTWGPLLARHRFELGTLDRRIAQFLELARGPLKDVRAPKGGYVRGAAAEGDASRVYFGLYDLGVTSHYAGDAAMPYHATSDFNG